MLKAALLLLLSAAPGLHAWWSSRALLRKLDDPLLPELFLARSQRIASIAGIAVVLGIFVARDHMPAVVLLVFVFSLAGGFPARQKIFGESWGLLTYLDHSLRFWLGLLGTFVLLAVIPWAMSLSGEGALLAGCALAVAAFAWAALTAVLFPKLLRARPLREAELERRFAEVLAKSNSESPALFEADAPGGVWINAFALPSILRPGVLFTRGLLSALTPAETTAIFSHEVAHLEEATRKKTACGLGIVLFVAAAAVFLWAGPLASLLQGWEWIWPLALLVALAAKARAHRAHETRSDLRAVELSGDPEALVSALTKMHSLLRMSRRWGAEYEERSTHPSLARRIQAIRNACGDREPLEEFEKLFISRDRRRAVLLDSRKLHWLVAPPVDGRDVLARSEERRSIAYEHLRELRLKGTLEERELVFVDSAGRKTRMPVAAEDVVALEGLLDRVDVRLGSAPETGSAPTGRLWSLVLLLLGIMPWFSWTVVGLAALALARPGEATFLALGVGALVSAALEALRSGPGAELLWWRPLLLALAAVPSLLRAIRKRSSETPALAAAVALGLFLIASLGLVSAVASALPAMHAHLWAREAPGAVAALAAGSAVLLVHRSVRSRSLAVLSASLSIAILALGSTAYREGFTGDLFASFGPALPVEERGLEKVREVSVPGGVYRLLLAPGAVRFAAAVVPAGEYHDESDTSEFLVETEPGRLDSFEAIAAVFLDSNRLLVLEREGRDAVLKLLKLPELVSEVVDPEIPLLVGVDLAADPATGAWQVAGLEWDGSRVLVRRGRLGFPAREELSIDLDNGLSSPLAVNGNGIALTERYDVSPGWRLGPVGGRLTVELATRKKGESTIGLGRTALSVHCLQAALSESRFICAASGGGKTALYALDPESASVQSLGSVPGERTALALGPGRASLHDGETSPLLVDLEEPLAIRPRGLSEGAVLAWSGDVLAVALPAGTGDETTVSLYTLRR